MSKFAITGGRRLKGELCPQGAKNEALQVICACLLTKEEVTLSNVPEILDVLKLIELLQGMGVQVGQNHESQLRATKMTSPDIRAGIALLIAALSAQGVSTIHNIDQIDRGYEHIDEKLNAIGAEIR